MPWGFPSWLRCLSRDPAPCSPSSPVCPLGSTRARRPPDGAGRCLGCGAGRRLGGLQEGKRGLGALLGVAVGLKGLGCGWVKWWSWGRGTVVPVFDVPAAPLNASARPPCSGAGPLESDATEPLIFPLSDLHTSIRLGCPCNQPTCSTSTWQPSMSGHRLLACDTIKPPTSPLCCPCTQPTCSTSHASAQPPLF